MEFTLPISCKLLKLSESEDKHAEFSDVIVDVNTQEDSVKDLKDKLQIQGFVIFYGEILDDAEKFRNFFDGREKIIVLDCGQGWQEKEYDVEVNAAFRLINAGFRIEHVLKSLGRAVWHEGMLEFTESARLLNKMIEDSAAADYQDRLVSVTLNNRGDLGTVGLFNEYDAEAPIVFRNDPAIEDVTEMCDTLEVRSRHFAHLSEEAKKVELEVKHRVVDYTPVIKKAGSAVVRIFGYHYPFAKSNTEKSADMLADEDGKYSAQRAKEISESKKFRVVPFTGFFVTPTLIISTKSCMYSKQFDSYASSYAFTRETRANHPFLVSGKDLIPCSEIRDMTHTLLTRIRQIGLDVPEDLIPPENLAVKWSDYILFEVAEEFKNETFLIPDSALLSDNELLLSLAYHGKPTESWLKSTFGDNGKDLGYPFTEDDLSEHFCGYNLKCCSVGIAKNGEKDGMIEHTCSLLPTSVGSPVIRIINNVDLIEEALSFSAINCGMGRVDYLANKAEEKLDSEQGSDNTEGGSKSSNNSVRCNSAVSVHNLAFVLVYQHFVAPRLQKHPCYPQVKAFLLPYRILAERERLRACHVKMLKDADDFNEYGMCFYEAKLLNEALQSFREGARMFSIAVIPDKTEYDAKLRDALQSNVSSVVISLKELGH